MNIELLEPLEVVAHESRAEAHRLPLLQVMIDPACVILERVERAVERPVVAKIVDTHFKPVSGEKRSQGCWRLVLALRHEVERRAEPETHFEFCNRGAPVEPLSAFDIVTEDKRERLAVGPARPAFWNTLRSLADWPRTPDHPAQGKGVAVPEGESRSLGNRRLQKVVKVEQVMQNGMRVIPMDEMWRHILPFSPTGLEGTSAISAVSRDPAVRRRHQRGAVASLIRGK